MIVLDAYAVLALLKGEAAATKVRRLLDRHPEARLPPTGVAEVLDHLVRLAGASTDEAVLDLAQLGLAAPEPLGADVAIHAGLLRARHYHRRDRPVSLADCVAAATAAASSSSLASADAHLLDLCRAEGIDTIALPDTSGAV